ncbi:hypothetical protein [Nocardiopsis sp. NRRL B-16309]|uniref:hypothetical protein n=1 Tax=Nocardiopsis sp. NRRL B-16309 TaxID=1519494 RepID=UPI0006B02CF6|nr:hypothetical protein [Nocardiopsis sp. NRRL B-16309]
MHDLDLILQHDDDTSYGDGATEETELAYELVDADGPEELDRFIGGLVRKAARSVGRTLRSDVGRAVGTVVRDAVSGAADTGVSALAGSVGGAVGRRVGSREAGERIGRRIAAGALKRFGQGELESDSGEADLEVARDLVRFAEETARRAARSRVGANPWRAAVDAALAAANEVGVDIGGRGRADGDRDGASRDEGDGDTDEFGFPQESEDDPGDGFADTGDADEGEEMELAAELLSVTDDAELDEFLGKVFRRARKSVKRAVRGPVGRRLGRALKGVAKKALPIAGGAAGTALGGPMGGTVGAALGSAAGRMFELELEGLSPEDQEFEVARRFVRLADEAARQAALAPPDLEPQVAARQALAGAAQRYAPGLVRTESEVGAPRSGRWVRRGRSIVITGV